MKIEKVKLNKININDLITNLKNGLEKYYEKCSIEYNNDYPDLQKQPYNLCRSGLTGKNPTILDVGSVSYLVPLVKREKIYNFNNIIKLIIDYDDKDNADDYKNREDYFLIGPCAGPFHHIGHNSELMANIYLKKNLENNEITVMKNNTYYADIDKNNENKYGLQKSNSNEFALLGNLYMSEGKHNGDDGKLIKIIVEKKLNKLNFTDTIRMILNECYPKEQISLGGIFIIENSQTKLHIMPDFSEKSLNNDNEINDWLKYFNMDPPLICLTTIHSKDQFNLDLRIEHTHCFNEIKGQGGHYHYSVEPDNMRIVAYLNLIETIYRIDRPDESAKLFQNLSDRCQ